ncbi:Phage-associated protein, partial [Candidatus Magnetobacterium bavaricum]
EYFGNKSSQWLSDLTHKEAPWKNVRKGLTPSTRGSRTITHASMMEYYSSL